LNEAPVEVPGTKKLTGTFTFPPPLCIGEPFVEANKRGGKDERSKGKQLIGGPMRGTAAFPGNFSVIPFLYVHVAHLAALCHSRDAGARSKAHASSVCKRQLSVPKHYPGATMANSRI
jgi:hypothetical protein